MKQLFTFIILLFLSGTARANQTYQKLVELNKCWREQKDIDAAKLPVYAAMTETEWIGRHLSIVEQTLRARSTDKLTVRQKYNRQAALNHLQAYRLAGAFPQNEDYSYRTPIFIDKHDNFCAVGYLVKATGYEHVSRMIAANSNLAYVREMNYPELNKWAKEYGFSTDELAWIQPTYGPPNFGTAPMGGGTDGVVHELFVDGSGDTLYVGGKFKNVDGTMTANNIAYVTQAPGKISWHTMGKGVNGPVYAVAQYQGKIFVAGAFTEAGGMPANNVACWDGTNWHYAGCTYGTIKDLVVFEGDLYAVGRFDVCAAMSEVNFAHWDGTRWVQHGVLPGIVNTIEVMDTTLLLGGRFIYLNDTLSAIKWNKSTYFQKFSNEIKHEVRDFEKFKGKMYAACSQLSLSDTSLFYELDNNSWQSMNKTYDFIKGWGKDTISVNTLCADNDTLSAGGHFFPGLIGGSVPLMHYLIVEGTRPAWISVDSAINKMVLYKGQMIIGGEFKYGVEGIKVNSIARKVYAHPPVKLPRDNKLQKGLHIYPNPTSPSSTINVENNFNATHFRMNSMDGKVIKEEQINSGKQPVAVPDLPSGVYNSEISNDEGEKATEQIIVK